MGNFALLFSLFLLAVSRQLSALFPPSKEKKTPQTPFPLI
jgi:hypothetical protein